MKKPRIDEIEMLRGMAFLAVVMQHALAHYFPMTDTRLEDGVILGLLLLLSKFAVPLFVFITGLVLFYNYDGDIRYGAFIRKRFKDVILPYIPWAVLYAVTFQRLNLYEAGSLPKLGMMIFTGKASYHLWYIVMIAQFYLLFPLLQRMVRRWKPKSVRTAAIIVLALGLLYVWLMDQGGAVYRSADAWDIPFLSAFFTAYLDRNALMFFFYFALGAAAGLYLDHWRAWLIRCRHYLTALYALMVCWMLYVVVSHFKLYPDVIIRYDDLSLLRPEMAVFLTVSVLAVYAASISFMKNAPVWLRQMLTLAGIYSYIAYLAHAYMLRYTERAADWLLPGGSITLRTLTAFALSAVVSVALAYLLRL
ncbi:acyltransferase, partial [Paenibacillus sepulcri]|nr:acyltransferase [Paenibacillus sepulcri]